MTMGPPPPVYTRDVPATAQSLSLIVLIARFFPRRLPPRLGIDYAPKLVVRESDRADDDKAVWDLLSPLSPTVRTLFELT